MSDITTWAVLTDGRYIRVLINKGQGNSLLTLKADDSQALSDLCYEVVTGIKAGAADGTASKQRTNMQLLADFLDAQLQAGLYQKLIIAAPISKSTELRGELKPAVSDVLVGELDKDLLALSIDDVEQQLGELLAQA